MEVLDLGSSAPNGHAVGEPRPSFSRSESAVVGVAAYPTGLSGKVAQIVLCAEFRTSVGDSEARRRCWSLFRTSQRGCAGPRTMGLEKKPGEPKWSFSRPCKRCSVEIERHTPVRLIESAIQCGPAGDVRPAGPTNPSPRRTEHPRPARFGPDRGWVGASSADRGLKTVLTLMRQNDPFGASRPRRCPKWNHAGIGNSLALSKRSNSRTVGGFA